MASASFRRPMTPLELHPARGNVRFTLRGIFRDEAAAQRKETELTAAGLEVLVFKETAPSGRAVSFVAARHNVEPASRAGLPQRHSTDWEATRMAIELFRRVSRRARQGGASVRWYKRLDVANLHACVQRYAWKGTRLQVAAGILSSTVVAHPFPNANHRTSLFLARLYLQSVGVKWPHYNLDGRGAKRFHRDTHAYFKDSKYYLQLLRHKDLARVALEEGYTHLAIGPATVAEIRPGDLVLSADELRRKHLERSAKLIRDLAGAAEADLEEENTRRLREWVAWYKG